MKKLLRYYLPYRKNLVLAVACNVLMSVFMVVSIPVLQPVLQVLLGGDFGASKLAPPKAGGFQSLENQFNAFFRTFIEAHGRETTLLLICGTLVVVFFFKNLFRYLALYFLAAVRLSVARDFRQRILEKFTRLPLSFFSSERKGDLMSRITADVLEIELSILSVIEIIFREPIVILGSLAFMLFISPKLTFFSFALLLFTGLIIGRIGRSLRKQSNEAQTQLGLIGSLIEETLGGLRIIKGFNAEHFQTARFERENSAFAKLQTRLARRRDLASPLSEFLGIAVVSVLMWYGSRLVFAEKLSAETFLTFLYAFYNVIDPAKAFSQASYSIRKGLGALDRVEAVLAADENIRDSENPLELLDFQKSVEFKNVSFAYANSERAAVEQVNFELKKGKMIALVGASGAGKSTIADLLPRFFDVSDGQISIDGKDIRRLRLRDLRHQMGIVSQEAILFNDSVRANITFGTDATDAEVEAAARAANAHEFIASLPDGYFSNIGDRGSKLSGGQRQRLTIARALLKNPPILILDEATSALDSESEQLVQAALENLMKSRTALVIAHRLSTVQHADEILVLEKGKIVERGSHDELMDLGGVYRKLVDLQDLG